MTLRRAHLAVIGGAVLVALLGASCAKAGDFGEVNAASGKYGASLETSTTIDGISAFAQSRGLSSNASKRAGATQSLLDAIADDPELLGELENLTPEELEELTGLTTDELDELGITPATVTALGSALKVVGGGKDDDGEIDTELANSVLVSGGALTAQGANLLTTAEPAVFAQLIGTAATVDRAVVNQVGGLLAVLDPEGLGQFAGDDGTLAIITILLSAVIGGDAGVLENLANAADIDPRFRGVVGALARLATTLEPEFVAQINRVTTILGPNTLRALGAAVGLLTRPAVADIVEIAVSDPVVMGTMFGSFVLMVPGLAELVAPESFGSDPRSIYTGMAALMLTSLTNMDAPGLRDFFELIGVTVHPDLLD